ncbi:MAG TPA: zf-HC2 domain-containing protein [Acidimicrobiales bacterium]|nr:zf-HC2 domain-containing protein [Acidimicrobiales bacterium]
MTPGGPAHGHLGELASAFLDGELAPPEAERARSHLAGCPDCTAELDATRRVRALVRDLPPVEPPFPLILPTAPGRRAGVVGVAAAVAAAVASVLMANVQSEAPGRPSVARVLETHATSLVNVEPVSQLAPAAVPLSSP